ncbi:hypothetical protein BKP37_13985 [Anaerobacillus alkalilacustris]|uniref:Peptidase M50 domain-containing protein n=1 Tax=Anaerobacillus alkalilacustris TaxID=393763 RepID=A0A1S2LJ49_9BACI|nr:site-2 protease family protein [Anaerobacillus alkalilacustris]OIJ12532.1 hypothetical protein BKP37_13985 [Anaerobacillus alkalilacustris]
MDSTLMMFFIALLLSVIVHELGHYASFRLFGGRVEEISLGFGPTLLRKKINGSVLSIRILPLGGFVQPNEKDFSKYNYIQKIIFFSAGIFMNLVLYFVSIGLTSISQGRSFINGLVVAMDGLIYIVTHLGELFKSLQIDLLFGSQGSVESQVQMVYDLGHNMEFWMMLAAINITLILLNSLPIPILDGGRIVMTTVEHLFLKIGVAKGKIEKVTNPIYFLSWMFVMGLICLQIISANTFQLVENVLDLKKNYGVTSVEIFLWISLITVIFINIFVFVSNRFKSVRP